MRSTHVSCTMLHKARHHWGTVRGCELAGAKGVLMCGMCHAARCVLLAAQDKSWREGDSAKNWVWLRCAAAAAAGAEAIAWQVEAGNRTALHRQHIRHSCCRFHCACKQWTEAGVK